MTPGLALYSRGSIIMWEPHYSFVGFSPPPMNGMNTLDYTLPPHRGRGKESTDALSTYFYEYNRNEDFHMPFTAWWA